MSIISIKSTLFTPILTVNHRIPVLFCGNTRIDRSCFPSVSPNIEAWSFLIKLVYRNLHVAFDFISQSTISNKILDTKIDRSFSHIHVDQILGLTDRQQHSRLHTLGGTHRHHCVGALGTIKRERVANGWLGTISGEVVANLRLEQSAGKLWRTALGTISSSGEWLAWNNQRGIV